MSEVSIPLLMPRSEVMNLSETNKQAKSTKYILYKLKRKEERQITINSDWQLKDLSNLRLYCLKRKMILYISINILILLHYYYNINIATATAGSITSPPLLIATICGAIVIFYIYI